MFINNREQTDWIKEKFEAPGILEFKDEEKRLMLARLIRSQRYDQPSVELMVHKGQSRL